MCIALFGLSPMYKGSLALYHTHVYVLAFGPPVNAVVHYPTKLTSPAVSVEAAGTSSTLRMQLL